MLMLIAASEQVEVRMWLTRRFVKLLWPLLRQARRGSEPAHPHPAQSRARKALLSIEHEQAVSKANFSQPYDDSTRATRWAPSRCCSRRIQTGHDPNGHPVVAMHPAEGQGVTLTRTRCCCTPCAPAPGGGEKSDWDMELKLPGVEPQEVPSARAGRSTEESNDNAFDESAAAGDFCAVGEQRCACAETIQQ